LGRKGIYKYDPDYTMKVELFDFFPKTKEEIFKKDNYRCVVCRRGRQDGIEICADHIRPKDNFKSFFNHGTPDWDWIEDRIKYYSKE